jgi:hypothetical protein
LRARAKSDDSSNMSTLAERKQKFLEILLTLGSLLTVFLGFVIGKSTILNLLVAFGLIFVVSSLLSYAAGLFPERVVSRRLRIGVRLAHGFLAVSFGGLVYVGVQGIVGGNAGIVTNLIAFVVSVVSMWGVFRLVARVMNMKEEEGR